MGAKLASLSGVVGATQDRGLSFITSSTFSAASAVSVDGCFTSSFDNYRLVLTATASALNVIKYRMRASGTDASSSDYSWTLFYIARGTSGSLSYSAPDSSGSLSYSDGTNREAVVGLDVCSPFLAAKTSFSGTGQYMDSSAVVGFSNSSFHQLSTSYDGITIIAPSGTITGTVSIFGYRKT